MLDRREDNLKSGCEPDVFDASDSDKNQGQSFDFSGNKEDYISLAEAARYTKFSQDYISLMARTGRLPAQKFGRNWKVRLRDVEDYIARMEAKAAAQEVRWSILTTRDLPIEDATPPQNGESQHDE